MHQTDVLVLGCGISGCTAALRAAQANLNVTVVTPASDVRESNSFYEQEGVAFRGEGDSTARFAEDLLKAAEGNCCHRAVDQLASQGPRVVQELLIDELRVEFEREIDGGWKLFPLPGHSCDRILRHQDLTGRQILDTLIQRLQEMPNVTFLLNHTGVDILTLAGHSKRSGDAYKKPACLGAYLMDNATGNVTTCLAKETIVATGGIAGLFPHTTSSVCAHGDGMAMAIRAGARVMAMDQLDFHPLAFYAPNERRVTLPDMLRQMGARILSHQGEPLEETYPEVVPEARANDVARVVYLEMVRSGADHLWLDLTQADTQMIQDKYPGTFQHCLNKGFDPSRDLLPIVPAARYCNGGVAVDKVGQSSLHRLRACGEVACTGVHGRSRLPGVSLLEGMVWALAAADDIVKQIDRYAYYIPEVRDWWQGEGTADTTLLKQDWSTLQMTMWNYLGVSRDPQRSRRGLSLLRDLHMESEQTMATTKLCEQSLALHNGLTAALLVAEKTA